MEKSSLPTRLQLKKTVAIPGNVTQGNGSNHIGLASAGSLSHNTGDLTP